MANVDNPHGLRPLGRTLEGGQPVIEEFTKDSSEAAAIFAGDAVNRETDGNIEADTATPGTTLYSGVSLNYGAAATETKHLVIISPKAVFECQDNADTEGFVTADNGLNVNLELNAGVVATQQSGHELDESTFNTTLTLDMHMLKLFAVPGNAYGKNARVEVVFNTHRMGHEGGAAGV